MPAQAKRRFIPMTVADTRQLTPNLIRLVLKGDGVAGFSPQCGGGYIKLAFDADSRPITNPEQLGDVTLRTYTIRSFDAAKRQLTVDFVLHSDGGSHDGPASKFARTAHPGDHVCISGPGGVKSLDPAADWYLIAGDMTALPAISAKLAERVALATPLKGYLVVELLDEADASCLDVPDGLELKLVINPNPAKNTDALLQAVRGLPWHEGQPFAWCAAEFSRMRAFREYVRGERDMGLTERYVSSYWMLGRTEEGHKSEKRIDTEHDNALGGG